MSKGEEIIAIIKARAEAEEHKSPEMESILAPDGVNLTNINEKNNETLDKLSERSR